MFVFNTNPRDAAQLKSNDKKLRQQSTNPYGKTQQLTDLLRPPQSTVNNTTAGKNCEGKDSRRENKNGKGFGKLYSAQNRELLVINHSSVISQPCICVGWR